MSQGPKKKSIQITKRRIDHCPAHTARNKDSFTTMVLWSVKSFNSPTVHRSLNIEQAKTITVTTQEYNESENNCEKCSVIIKSSTIKKFTIKTNF